METLEKEAQKCAYDTGEGYENPNFNQAVECFVKGSVFGFENGVKHTKEEYEEIIKKQKEILLKITGWDKPYNLIEIISSLVFATDYLLHVKDYDGHNHEELNQSIDRAKEIMQFLETREAHFL